ncbi:MAG: hypothetical protein QM619_16155 [Micropruina sp.]|uniref:hypothetical protein n=1 Tax=Micropruina sp. TaxID=2737536 RepID=UPI0039E31237
MIADLRGVLLDLDGTLLDHRGAADRAAIAWARQLGLADDGDSVARWRQAESQHYPQFERGECSFQEQRRRRVRAFSSALAGIDDARADALFDDYAAPLPAELAGAPRRRRADRPSLRQRLPRWRPDERRRGPTAREAGGDRAAEA